MSARLDAARAAMLQVIDTHTPTDTRVRASSTEALKAAANELDAAAFEAGVAGEKPSSMIAPLTQQTPAATLTPETPAATPEDNNGYGGPFEETDESKKSKKKK